MKPIRIQSVNIFQDECIYAFDPEYADMGNPNGARYEQQLFIHAITSSGQRFIHTAFQFETDEVARAERVAARILACRVINPEHWVETFAVYGSAYWQGEDMERQFAWDSNAETRGTVRDY